MATAVLVRSPHSCLFGGGGLCSPRVTGYLNVTDERMWPLSQNPEWTVSTPIWSSRMSLARMDNKWTALVVIALGRGNLRFGDLRAAVEGNSAKVLTETLRDLERDGLVARHVHAEMPPRVEYELTALGGTLHGPMRALGQWAEDHAAEVLVAREAYDAAR